MTDAIVTHNLGKTFGRLQALKAVNFAVKTGEPIGLVGPNGSGKTTLFSIISGFLAPCSGSISVLGHAPNDPRLHDRVAILPQDVQMYKGIPVVKQLTFFAKLQGASTRQAKSAALEVLDDVGLGDIGSRSPDQLSHGMLKRATIAQAFLGTPELVLLDEPTSGIDPVLANQIRHLIRKHQKQRTFLISSHNLEEIENLCSQVIILKKGEVTENKRMADLVGRTNAIRFRFEQALPISIIDLIRDIPNVTTVTVSASDEKKVAIHFTESADAQIDIQLLTLFQQQNIAFIEMMRGESLEDKVVELTRQ